MSDEPINHIPGGNPPEPGPNPELGPDVGPPSTGPDVGPPDEVPEVGPDVWPGPHPEKVPPSETQPPASVSKQLKLALGAVLAVAVVVGLFFANRYLITPATKVRMQAGGLSSASGPHPEAPGFSLTDLSGQKINLEDYKGKVVLLDFWATWCGPCRLEIPWFVDLENQYRDRGFAVIGVSMDDGPEPVREFYKQFKMNYPVGMGDDKVSELYGGILGLPTSFLIGRDGRIYAKHVGASDRSVFEEEIEQLLAAGPDSPLTDFKQVGGASPDTKIEVSSLAEVNSEVPGIDLTRYPDTEKKAFEETLAKQNCSCGCKLTLLRCRQIDRSCNVSLKAAREIAKVFFVAKRPGSASSNPASIGSPSASETTVQR